MIGEELYDKRALAPDTINEKLVRQSVRLQSSMDASTSSTLTGSISVAQTNVGNTISRSYTEFIGFQMFLHYNQMSLNSSPSFKGWPKAQSRTLL